MTNGNPTQKFLDSRVAQLVEQEAVTFEVVGAGPTSGANECKARRIRTKSSKERGHGCSSYNAYASFLQNGRKRMDLSLRGV